MTLVSFSGRRVRTSDLPPAVWSGSGPAADDGSVEVGS
jgi:hypothetical protein